MTWVRRTLLFATLLLVAGCSCQRSAEQAQKTATGKTSAVEDAHPSPQETPPPVASISTAPSDSQAASVVHAYLRALTSRKWSEADAYWAGGKAPLRPGDESIRTLEDPASLRIRNEATKPLDQESPPRALEVPVTIRIQKSGGFSRISGWYRLRRKLDGEGWEITSASMRPSLD